MRDDVVDGRFFLVERNDHTTIHRVKPQISDTLAAQQLLPQQHGFFRAVQFVDPEGDLGGGHARMIEEVFRYVKLGLFDGAGTGTVWPL